MPWQEVWIRFIHDWPMAEVPAIRHQSPRGLRKGLQDHSRASKRSPAKGCR